MHLLHNWESSQLHVIKKHIQTRRWIPCRSHTWIFIYYNLSSGYRHDSTYFISWQSKCSRLTIFSSSVGLDSHLSCAYNGPRPVPKMFFHALLHLVLITTLRQKLLLSSILQLRKLQHREVKYLTQNHLTSKWQPVLSDFKIYAAIHYTILFLVWFIAKLFRSVSGPCFGGCCTTLVEVLSPSQWFLSPTHCPSICTCCEIKASLFLLCSISHSIRPKQFTWKEPGGKWDGVHSSNIPSKDAFKAIHEGIQK